MNSNLVPKHQLYFLFSLILISCSSTIDQTVIPNKFFEAINYHEFQCDTYINYLREEKSTKFDWEVTNEIFKLKNKTYYPLYDHSFDKAELMGYVRIYDHKVFFLYKDYEEVKDFGADEQIFFDFRENVGIKREIKGVGNHLPYHEIVLMKKEFVPALKDTILTYATTLLPDAWASHTNYLDEISVGERSGITQIKRTLHTSRGDDYGCSWVR